MGQFFFKEEAVLERSMSREEQSSNGNGTKRQEIGHYPHLQVEGEIRNRSLYRGTLVEL